MEYVWLVEQYKGDGAFEVQGVFTTKVKAIAACHSDQFIVMRLTPDEELPIETDDACVLSWYPHTEKDPTLVEASN